MGVEKKKKTHTYLKEKKHKVKAKKIWTKALKIIPGGNGLISKRPERFLPGLWPTYYKSSNGIIVKDIGVDENGQPTINGKPALNFRIEKLLPQEKKSKKTQDEEKK